MGALADRRRPIVEGLAVKVKKLSARRARRKTVFGDPHYGEMLRRSDPLGTIFVAMLNFCAGGCGLSSDFVEGSDVNGSVRESYG